MAATFPHSTIQCLAAVAQHHRLPIYPDRLIEDYALPPEEPGAATVLKIAGDIGLKAKFEKLAWDTLLAQDGVFPLVARLLNGASVIVIGATKDALGQVAVLNPLADRPEEVLKLGREAFCKLWNGEVLLLKRLNEFVAPKQAAFGLRWFIPEIMKQRGARSRAACRLLI